MSIRLITRSQITQLLPMHKAIELMREGFSALAEDRVMMPPRQRIVTADGDMLLKPACLPGKGLCVKLVMTYPDNPKNGLPLVQGLLMVFDDMTGCPLAVMEAGELVIPGIEADAELGEIITGKKPGRTDEQQITMFKSVGVAVQDAVCASFVLAEAERLNIGTEVDMTGSEEAQPLAKHKKGGVMTGQLLFAPRFFRIDRI